MPRPERAYRVRLRAAERVRAASPPAAPGVNDEERYPGALGSFTKGLPHGGLGEVNPYAWRALLAALGGADPAAFEDVPMGGTARLRNPLAGLAFAPVGPDPHGLALPAPPALASAEIAAEWGELAWQALARDVPFAAYGRDPTVAAAVADLDAFSDFRGPKAGGRVTAGTLFRAPFPGVGAGPFVSQFLLKDVPAGNRVDPQPIRTLPPTDHLTDYDGWLAAQDGVVPPAALAPVYDPTPRYLRNGRDLAEAVHNDWPGQAAHNAGLMAFGAGAGVGALAGVLAAGGVPLAPGNPNLASRTQGGFGTFDLPNVTCLVALATWCALKAAWYQLAWNIAVGRLFAGIHWRSDAVEGLRLGEAVALGILRDERRTYPEAFGGFGLTRFDGGRVTV